MRPQKDSVGGAPLTRIKRRSATLALVLLLASSLAPGARAIESCAALTTILSLTGPGGSFQDFFVATESGGGSFYVWRDGDYCTEGEWTRVWYSATGVSTGAGDLNLNPDGPVTLYAPVDSGSGPNFQRVDVAVTGPVSGVEKATVRLDEAQHSGDDVPFYVYKAAPLYVLDTDGPAGFALGEAVLRRSEGLTVQIPVFRTGPVGGSGSVQYEIEPQSAAAGEDYTVPSSNSVSFSGTSRRGLISIPLKSDGRKENDESFRVTLQAPGSQTEAVVTIVDTTVEDLRPLGRFHHPRRNFKYPQNYPWLNEIHIFTSAADEVRDPVHRAQIALRKRWKDGSCAWWNGNGFTRGGCENVRWLGKNVKQPAKNYFKYKVKKRLPLSVGTSIDDYKIWGRWYDGAGRVSQLRKGRNLNEFEVIKPTAACRNNPFNFRKCKPVKP
jgi:Calx-beta domain